jgi:phosphoribosylformimino-5-aminoimidazole carboxamide ribonucleotide (ProFAR) isomerase
MLGPGNEGAALEALAAWPRGLQVGGGITDGNAGEWIERGAEKVGCAPMQLQRRLSWQWFQVLDAVGVLMLKLISLTISR